jgi:predicted transcriptional regulator
MSRARSLPHPVPRVLPLRRALRPATVRKVWAAVTRTPNASMRELACRLDLCPDTVCVAIQTLHVIGYITYEPGTVGARRVLIPFVDGGPAGGKAGVA